MKITAQEEYGLRCLLRLARAAEGQSLTIPEIAADEGLSAPYVAKLLAVLRQAGLIESVRGRAGGYRLAKPSADIPLGSVMRVLGEPLFDEPGYCQRHAGTETPDGACVHLGSCTLRALWHTLEQWMRRTLDQITLADLLQSEGRITELLRSRLADALAEPPSSLITLTPLSQAARGSQDSAPGWFPEVASGRSD
jgi:Rrf2 family protein